MTDYAIGDIQGCYDSLLLLLDKIHFNERLDRLWFVGDLVNRGPQSLEVLRFIKDLPLKSCITLGNHDLHLLNKVFTDSNIKNKDDTLTKIIAAPDKEELGHWLRQQSMIHYDSKLNVVMCHAGIPPIWHLDEAIKYALELQLALSSDDYKEFLQEMYGNEPSIWSPSLKGIPRLRCLTNYFTRMRFCDSQGNLLLTYKGKPTQTPAGVYPWYNVPHRIPIKADIIFGHWAALEGRSPAINIHAIDTGCVWGGALTALRLTDKKRFEVINHP